MTPKMVSLEKVHLQKYIRPIIKRMRKSLLKVISKISLNSLVLDMSLFNDAFLLDSLINEIKIMKQLTCEVLICLQTFRMLSKLLMHLETNRKLI
jgi:hypothetical protein